MPISRLSNVSCEFFGTGKLLGFAVMRKEFVRPVQSCSTIWLILGFIKRFY